jgi:methionyl aminopeptidase
VVKLDLGTLEDGQYDDGATTILVGNCSSAARRLVKGTKEALDAGVSAAISGNTTHDIAKAISAVAEQYDLHVIHGYGGHGIGEKLHMEPIFPMRSTAAPRYLW